MGCRPNQPAALPARRYTLQPDYAGASTRVRVDVTVEPVAFIPDFLIEKASKPVLEAATEGLRTRVLRDMGSDQRT